MDALIKAQRKRISKHPLADKIDDEQYFRNFYLPWIVMDVFYDYVDTILLQAAQMRIEPLKKVCRQIKAYRADYDYLKNRYTDWEQRQVEKEHMEYFIEIFEKEFNTEYKLAKWQVSNKRKLLEDDWRTFIACVYMAVLIYKGLKEYCKEVDRFVNKLKGGGTYHSIIPDMVTMTFMLVLTCLGDCDVLTANDLKASAQRIAEMIKSVRFTDDPTHKRINGKTIRERYLEEKGDLPKAPNGTANKLMKEFGVKSKKKYYNLIR